MKKLILICSVAVAVFFTSCKSDAYKRCLEFYNIQKEAVENIKDCDEVENFYKYNYKYYGSDVSVFYQGCAIWNEISEKEKKDLLKKFNSINEELIRKESSFGCNSEYARSMKAFYDLFVQTLMWRPYKYCIEFAHYYLPELNGEDNDITSFLNTEEAEIVYRKRDAVKKYKPSEDDKEIQSGLAMKALEVTRPILQYYQEAEKRGKEYVPDYCKFHGYNIRTEGWEKYYEKNAWGEEMQDSPYLIYSYRGEGNWEYLGVQVELVANSIWKVLVYTWVDDWRDYVTDLMVKDNRTGEVTHFEFDEIFYKETYDLVDDGGIWLYAYQAIRFFNKIATLDDFSVAFKVEGQTDYIVIKNPTNLKNFQDAVIHYFNPNPILMIG